MLSVSVCQWYQSEVVSLQLWEKLVVIASMFFCSALIMQNLPAWSDTHYAADVSHHLFHNLKSHIGATTDHGTQCILFEGGCFLLNQYSSVSYLTANLLFSAICAGCSLQLRRISDGGKCKAVTSHCRNVGELIRNLKPCFQTMWVICFWNLNAHILHEPWRLSFCRQR